MKRVLLFLLLFLVSCASSRSTLGPYSIGRDPSWFPLRLKEMTVNINGFTNGLVQELAKVEKRAFEIVDVKWNQLFEGLDKGDYAGIFSSLSSNLITQDRYTFSDPFLWLGPVLVVRAGSPVHSLADLSQDSSAVGAYQYDDSVLIIQQYPSILIKTYQNLTEELEDLVNGNLEGALIPNLEALTLVPALYGDELKIASEPLSEMGLRLITLKGEYKDLIDHFNAGLKALQESGAYHQLQSKFGITPSHG